MPSQSFVGLHPHNHSSVPSPQSFDYLHPHNHLTIYTLAIIWRSVPPQSFDYLHPHNHLTIYTLAIIWRSVPPQSFDGPHPDNHCRFPFLTSQHCDSTRIDCRMVQHIDVIGMFCMSTDLLSITGCELSGIGQRFWYCWCKQ